MLTFLDAAVSSPAALYRAAGATTQREIDFARASLRSVRKSIAAAGHEGLTAARKDGES